MHEVTPQIQHQKDFIYYLIFDRSDSRKRRAYELFHILREEMNARELYRFMLDIILEFIADMCPSILRYYLNHNDVLIIETSLVLEKIFLFMLYIRKHSNNYRKRYLIYVQNIFEMDLLSNLAPDTMNYFIEKSLALTEIEKLGNQSMDYKFLLSDVVDIKNLDLLFSNIPFPLPDFLSWYSPYLKDLINSYIKSFGNEILPLLWSLYIYWNHRVEKTNFIINECDLFDYLNHLDPENIDHSQLQRLIDQVTLEDDRQTETSTDEEFHIKRPSDEFFGFFDEYIGQFILTHDNILIAKRPINHISLQAYFCRKLDWQYLRKNN